MASDEPEGHKSVFEVAMPLADPPHRGSVSLAAANITYTSSADSVYSRTVSINPKP